jgi:hypothetical protein
MENSSSFYLFLSHKDSTEYFPNNASNDFRIKLKTPLILDEHWYIALCEARLPIKSDDSSRSLTIFCDICKASIIHDRALPVLRQIGRREARQTAAVHNKQYFPITQRYIDTLHIYIRNEKDQDPVFTVHPVELTLHLTRIVAPKFI